MEPVRRALFEKALKFYEGFLQEHGADRSIRKATSDAYHRMGSMYTLLGQHVRAEKAFREAITLREQLATEFPGAATYRAELGWSYHALGGALGFLGRPHEAEKALRRSLELWQPLAARTRLRPGIADGWLSSRGSWSPAGRLAGVRRRRPCGRPYSCWRHRHGTIPAGERG